MAANESEVCVKAVNGETEGQQLKAFLQANGIRCRLAGEALRNTHALTLNGLGEVRILVAAEDAEKARELIKQAEAGELALDGD